MLPPCYPLITLAVLGKSLEHEREEDPNDPPRGVATHRSPEDLFGTDKTDVSVAVSLQERWASSRR